MVKRKRNCSALLCGVTFVLTVIGAASAGFAGERALGVPIRSVTVPAAAQGMAPDGRNFAYIVANGDPAVFQVLEVPSGQLVFSYALPATHASWGMVVAPDQTVYFGTQRHGQLFSWSPGDERPTNLSGRNIIGESHIWRLAADEEGRIYGGTYPGGKVFSYDPGSGVIRDYGIAKAGLAYIRSTAVAGDFIYAGTSPEAHLVEIHKVTGAKREIPLPASHAGAESIYDLTASGGHLFARLPPTNDVLVYNLERREWVKTIPSTMGLEVSLPGPDGRIYLNQEGRLVAYDPAANEVERTESPMPFGSRSSHWVELGLEGYPGKSLVVVGMRGDFFFYNPRTGRSERRTTEAEGVPIVVRALETGPDGNVYVGGYLAPQEMAVFDPDVGEIIKLPGTIQVEAMHAHDGKLYIGRYPNASVLEFDPELPWDFGKNPHVVTQLSGYHQDRPFGFASVGRKVAIGTVPKSGHLGGVLAFYDSESGETDVHEGVVEDQGIVSLAHRDGFVYGGTTVWGGLGIEPTTVEAVLFIWDVAGKEKVFEGVPIGGEKAISSLAFDDRGHLWGLTSGKLFRFDPAERTIALTRELFPFSWSQTYWQSGFLEYDAADGKFYGSTLGRLFSYDPQADLLEVMAEGARYFARDRNGDFYFSRGTELIQRSADVSEGPFVLYLDSEGDDEADGKTEATALRSLERVHSILEKERPDGDVSVLIAPGTYHAQQVRWSYTRPDFSISFLPLVPGEIPVFDACEAGSKEGACGGGTWFVLTHSAAEATNLVFDSLRIQNYHTAISFNGNRNNTLAFNSRNTIRNCYFYRIGNISNPGLRGSTAAVRFVNSKENRIENNDFVDIINTESPGRLHALYLAHHADLNEIHNNRFVHHSGDAVRLRDFSNANIITGNLFDRAGQGGAFSEWYCDHDARNDCTKPTPECPSWLNEFHRNRIGKNFHGEPLPEFVFYQADSTTGCERPSPDAERLVRSGNTIIQD